MRLLPLGVVARPQLGLDRAAHALERAGGDDPLRRAADAHQHVHLGPVPGGADRAGDVAVGDEPDPGPGPSRTSLDQLGVAGPVEDADGDVGDAGVLDLGDPAQVLRDAGVDVDRRRRSPGRRRASPCRRRRSGRTSRPARRPRAPRSRSACPCSSAWCRRSGRPRRRPPGRVPSPTCSPLNSIGALSFSPSPITTTPAHRHRVDQLAHGVDGGAVAALLVAAADPAAGGHRRGLGDPDQVQGQVAVEILRDGAAWAWVIGFLLAPARGQRIRRQPRPAGSDPT